MPSDVHKAVALFLSLFVGPLTAWLKQIIKYVTSGFLCLVSIVYSLSQEKDCASLYEMKTYVEPNEIEPSLVCIHHYFLSALAVCYNLQFPLIYIDIHHCVCLSALASEHC